VLAPLGATLTSLQAAHNQVHVLTGLAALPRLTALDLSHNQLADLPALVAALREAPALVTLQLAGNPVAQHQDALRATLATHLPTLATCDGVPVGAQARAAAAESQLALLSQRLSDAERDATDALRRAQAAEAAAEAARESAARASRATAEAERRATEAEQRACAAEHVAAEQEAAFADGVRRGGGHGDPASVVLLRQWRAEARDALVQAAASAERELATAQAAHAAKCAAEQQTAAVATQVKAAVQSALTHAQTLLLDADAKIQVLEARIETLVDTVRQESSTWADVLAAERARTAEAEDALAAAVSRASSLHARVRSQTSVLAALRDDALAAVAERDEVLRRAGEDAQLQAHVLAEHAASVAALRRDLAAARREAARVHREAEHEEMQVVSASAEACLPAPSCGTDAGSDYDDAPSATVHSALRKKAQQLHARALAALEAGYADREAHPPPPVPDDDDSN